MWFTDLCCAGGWHRGVHWGAHRGPDGNFNDPRLAEFRCTTTLCCTNHSANMLCSLTLLTLTLILLVVSLTLSSTLICTLGVDLHDPTLTFAALSRTQHAVDIGHSTMLSI